MYACIHGPNAEALAQPFSPWIEVRIEVRDLSTAIFALTPRQFAERVWERIPSPPAQVAVAATVETAVLAAHNLPGRTVIDPGEEARVLGALPVDCLASDPEHVEILATLDAWGIHSLADLSSLPEADLAARLGDPGVRLHRLARGALARPLRPEIAATVYEESAEFDHPIELRAPLEFVIARFLHEITPRMRAQSLAASALRLTLNRETRALSLPFPTLDIKLLLKLVEHSLDRQPPTEPIERVHLELEPTHPRRVQHGLFTPAAPEPEKLELTLGKIRGLVGEGNVGYPEVFDTHRPGVGKPASPLLPAIAFRRFRPPLEARVRTEGGTPQHLATKMFRGRIVQASGPWRSSGEWWRGEADAGGDWKGPNAAWRSDEWDLRLDDGALYRLCLDRILKQWFVEGVYD